MFISIQAALWVVLHVAKEAQEQQPSSDFSPLHTCSSNRCRSGGGHRSPFHWDSSSLVHSQSKVHKSLCVYSVSVMC